MTDPAAAGARAAAARLTGSHGPDLAPEVEAALYARAGTSGPVQYTDPVAVAALIVSVAQLAWTVYQDRRRTDPAPPPEVIARHVRVRLAREPEAPGPELEPTDRDRIIEVVIEETVRSAAEDGTAPETD
ncbi:hypothetical protein [Streptomyces sp. NPDC004783]|uniref:hypothetical protein n=1 Tax=Streptomyces sp. NPDC004783 TaxID=3154459 RepID=UPI00339EA2A6